MFLRHHLPAICVVCLLAPSILLAQEDTFVHHTPRTQYLFPEEAGLSYVLVDGASVHDAPAKDADVVLLAASGSAVSVLDVVLDTMRMNGISSYWYQVEVGAVQGWTWGGNLAQRAFGSHADAAVKFFGGIDHVMPSDSGLTDHSYRLIAVKGGKEVGRIVVRSFAWGFEEVRNSGDLGLPNVDDVITLTVPCVGGCGCATGEVVVFWSGDHFHQVADLVGTPDGAYSENVLFLYPSDMDGEPGAVVRVTSTYEEDGSDTDEGEEYVASPTLTRILRREYLRWDGKGLVPQGKPMEEKRYTVALD